MLNRRLVYTQQKAEDEAIETTNHNENQNSCGFLNMHQTDRQQPQQRTDGFEAISNPQVRLSSIYHIAMTGS